MAADVSTLVRLLNKHLDEQQRLTTTTENQTRTAETNLITRDLFGSSSSSSKTSKDIDLDLQVPPGFEKRLDLESGKVYLQRRNSPISSTSTTTTTTSDLQSSTSNNNVDATLDLKLVQSYDSRSVCTLDKVKSALERAEKAESAKKRSLSRDDDEEEEERSSLSSSKLLFAGGCSSCLMYVMISKSDPKCPRCDSIVAVPCLGVKEKNKKPKLDLDLNLNLLSSSW